MTRRRLTSDQAGFTLVELLVVLVLMGIIGGAITNIVVTTLQTSRTNSDVRGKLEQTRLAVERVREQLRGADEVCSYSNANAVSIWTDRNRDGEFQADEVITFSVVTDAGQRRLQRQDGAASPRVIVNNVAAAGGYFAYDLAPAVQAPDLKCQSGLVPTGGANDRTTTVDVTVPITSTNGADPANASDMTVSTSMTLRNAIHGVVSSVDAGPPAANNPPIASFTWNCPTLTCTFQSTSTDPDGDLLTQLWDLGDHPDNSTTSPLSTFSHTFAVPGTYTVTLHVRDHRGAVSSTFQNVAAIAPPPDVMYVSDMDDVSILATNGTNWTPAVEIEVTAGANQRLQGALVEGVFSLPAATGQCTTGANGRCVITAPTCITVPGQVSGCPYTNSNSEFTVTAVTRPDYTHDPALFTDPDADNSGNLTIALVGLKEAR